MSVDVEFQIGWGGKDSPNNVRMGGNQKRNEFGIPRKKAGKETVQYIETKSTWKFVIDDRNNGCDSVPSIEE